VVVGFADPADARVACGGARDALRFLAAQGLDVAVSIPLDIVPALPGAAGTSAAGCFLESSGRAAILTYAAFRQLGIWFGLPVDRGLYRSLAAHEVAHAVAAANFRRPVPPPIAAKEYVAYVTTLAVMDPARRARVLARFPGEPFAGDWQMNTFTYLADPMRFGARAYRHYLAPGHGRAYLQAVLAGQALLD
jgi:hypothetical protein